VRWAVDALAWKPRQCVDRSVSWPGDATVCKLGWRRHCVSTRLETPLCVSWAGDATVPGDALVWKPRQCVDRSVSWAGDATVCVHHCVCTMLQTPCTGDPVTVQRVV